MCGLVGVFGNILQKDINYFRDALVADSVRGFHSTGVATVSYTKKSNSYSTWYHKDTGTGAEAAGGATFKGLYNDIDNWAIIGHNRWATTGAINSDNAHPFTHGRITLMHNGTLDTMVGLRGTHDTDSERICDSLANEDTVEVLESLQGAFVLVWLDSDNNTINFARNEDRPLAMVHSHNKEVVYYASEVKMMEWCLDRNNVSIGSNKPVSLTAGEWWSFEIGAMGKGCEIAPTVVKFTPQESFNWNTYGYNTSKKHSYSHIKPIPGVPSSGFGFSFIMDDIQDAGNKNGF